MKQTPVLKNQHALHGLDKTREKNKRQTENARAALQKPNQRNALSFSLHVTHSALRALFYRRHPYRAGVLVIRRRCGACSCPLPAALHAAWCRCPHLGAHRRYHPGHLPPTAAAAAVPPTPRSAACGHPPASRSAGTRGCSRRRRGSRSRGAGTAPARRSRCRCGAGWPLLAAKETRQGLGQCRSQAARAAPSPHQFAPGSMHGRSATAALHPPGSDRRGTPFERSTVSTMSRGCLSCASLTGGSQGLRRRSMRRMRASSWAARGRAACGLLRSA